MSRAAGWMALLLLALGCGARTDSNDTANASENGMPASADLVIQPSQSDFERWLRLEAGIDPREAGEPARAPLYREYVAERLFAAEARAKSIRVPEEALAEELARRSASTDDAPETQRREEAERKLLAVLYEEQVIRPQIKVAPAEVERRLKQLPSRPVEEVFFRSLRADSEAAAVAAVRRVGQNGETFESVAEAVSTAPDKGALQQRALSDLPAAAAAALGALREGDVSPPVPIEKAWYLFQLEARNRDPDPARTRDRAQIQASLVQQQFDAAREREIERLAQQQGVSLVEATTDKAVEKRR